MPNYCHNRLVIEGSDDELDKLVVAVADPSSDERSDRFSFARIVPVGEGQDEGDAWGSTGLYCLKIKRSSGQVVYEFESSWDPPSAIFDALAAQWPGLTMEVVYVEPLTGRYGTRFYRGGVRQRWNEGGCWSFGDDDYEMRAFLYGEWPQLAEKWWGEEEDDDYEDDYDLQENYDYEDDATEEAA